MSPNTPGKVSGALVVEVLLTYVLLLHSAFWGQTFVAELNRISEHGERKLKMRRESMAVSPSVDGPARGETTPTPAAPKRGTDGSQWVDGTDGKPDGVPEGPDRADGNGTAGGAVDGVPDGSQ